MERREGLKKRVKEIEMARGGADAEPEGECGPHLPSEAEGRETTMSASDSTVEESVVGSAPEVHEAGNGGVNSSSDGMSR